MVEGVELASCFDVPYNDPILARHHDLLARRRKVRAGDTGHAGLLFLPKFLFKRHKYDGTVMVMMTVTAARVRITTYICTTYLSFWFE